MRRATPADREAIHRVESAAFGRVAEADLVDRVAASDRAVAALSLVAEVEGEVVGHVLFSHVAVSTEKGPCDVLALGPVAVHPDRQRAGIGSTLIRAGLLAADELGEPLVVVLGSPDYYQRFGFLPAGRMGLEPPAELPRANFLALPLAAHDPSIHGPVVYGPAWDGV